jgi:hypothetical protein
MSARARARELAREEHLRELDLMAATTRRQLDDVRRETASLQRRVGVVLHPRRWQLFWRVSAGILSLPLLTLMGCGLMRIVSEFFPLGR